MSYANLGEMYLDVSTRFAQKTGAMYKEGGVFRSLQFAELQHKMLQLSAGLQSLGVQKGDRVLLLAENRYEWALADFAILSAGGVTVPVYPTLMPHHIEYIVNNCEGKILILSADHQLEKIREVRENLARLKHLILMEGEAPAGVLGWEEVLERGARQLEKQPECIRESIKKINRDDVASIIYTSGTTGLPKGVVLTHGNFLSNVEGALDAIQVQPDEIFLSFLPLSHSFERLAGHFLATYSGATIAYAESIETVAENLREVRPTLMAGVPRFFEKIYGRVLDSLEEGSALKRKIFMWALGVGRITTLYRQKKRPIRGLLKLKHKLADRLVYSKLKERVGGRMRLFVSGGAPLAKEIAEFFNAAGLTLLEGYGLTETSPVITVNRPDQFKFGSAGLPISNVEVRIAEDGEILTRGPHVMKEYYKNPEETRETIDSDGWLHTGDIGYLDKDGFLFITDRKKNILVTSGGKNVAPQPIENLLNGSRYIEQSVVIGDRRKYCTALIVVNPDNLQNWARQQDLEFGSLDDLLTQPKVQQFYREEIDAVSVDLASYETIKKFRLLKEPFTIESGELTPTLKVKRNVLAERYGSLIEEMYAEDESAI